MGRWGEWGGVGRVWWKSRRAVKRRQGRWSQHGRHAKGSTCTQVLSKLKVPRYSRLRSPNHNPTIIQYSPATCGKVPSDYIEPTVSAVVTRAVYPASRSLTSGMASPCSRPKDILVSTFVSISLYILDHSINRRACRQIGHFFRSIRFQGHQSLDAILAKILQPEHSFCSFVLSFARVRGYHALVEKWRNYCQQ